MIRIAREVVTRQIDAHEFSAQAQAFARERPELTHVTWLSAKRERRSSVGAAGFQADGLMSADGDDPSMPMPNQSNAAAIAFEAAKDRRQPVYSPPFSDANGVTVFQLQIPLIDRGGFAGVLIAEYSVEALLRYYVPSEVATRHSIAVLDSREQVVSSTVTPMPGQVPAPGVAAARRAACAGAQRPGAARPGLAHLHRPHQQRAVLAGAGAGGHDGVDAAGHLAPHAPAHTDPERADAGDQLPPRDGELHADRHARHGHGHAHHLREPGLLRDDGLLRGRPRRSHAALPPSGPSDRREENARLLAAGTAGAQPFGWGGSEDCQRKDGSASSTPGSTCRRWWTPRASRPAG